jgi:hypothetical protein
MSPIVNPKVLLDAIRERYERETTQEGYRPILAEMTADEDINLPSQEQLVRHEPALAALLREFDWATDVADCEPRNVWLVESAGGYKRRMAELVGKWAETKDPFLQTSEAYDVAYQAFMKILAPKQNAWATRQEQLEEGATD